jgi:hypothetical protein
MAAELSGHTWTHLGSATREECEKARKYVASKATGVEDCTDLLAKLGLLPAGHPATLRPQDHGLPGYRKGCRCKRCRKANSMRLERQKAARKGATA